MTFVNDIFDLVYEPFKVFLLPSSKVREEHDIKDLFSPFSLFQKFKDYSDNIYFIEQRYRKDLILECMFQEDFVIILHAVLQEFFVSSFGIEKSNISLNKI